MDQVEPCEGCPFFLSAPKGVWAEGHYSSLLGVETRTTAFFCHAGRPGPREALEPCLGLQAFRAGDPRCFRTSRELVVENLNAMYEIATGGACPGSGKPARSGVVKARCPDCGQVVPAGPALAYHLPAERT